MVVVGVLGLYVVVVVLGLGVVVVVVVVVEIVVLGEVGRVVLLPGAEPPGLGSGSAGMLSDCKTFLMAFSSGYLPLPQRPRKSSVSTDHTMPPPRPMALAYCALIVILSMLS